MHTTFNETEHTLTFIYKKLAITEAFFGLQRMNNIALQLAINFSLLDLLNTWSLSFITEEVLCFSYCSETHCK